MTTTPRRPQGVTLACIFAGISSLLLLGNVVSLLSDWGSLALQEQINTVITQEPLASLGISMSDALVWLRWVLLGVVVLSISGVVLSIYTARGHRQSRVTLSVLCVFAGLLFVSSGMAGLLPGAFSFACAVMLWSRDARAWFAIDRTAQASGDVPDEPRRRPQIPPVAEKPTLPVMPTEPIREPIGERPREVLIAALIMVIGSGLVFAVAGLNALMYLAAKADYVQIIRDNEFMAKSVADLNLTPDSFARILFIACAALCSIALLGVLGGFLLFGRNPASRVFGIIMAVVATVVSVIGFPVSLPWTAAAITVIVLVNRPASKSWYVSRHDTHLS